MGITKKSKHELKFSKRKKAKFEFNFFFFHSKKEHELKLKFFLQPHNVNNFWC
jgi:hypothetical protein